MVVTGRIRGGPGRPRSVPTLWLLIGALIFGTAFVGGQSAEQVAWASSGALSVTATTSLTIQWELPQTDNATTLYTVYYSSVTNGNAEVTVSLSDAEAISVQGTLISPVSLTLANLESGTEYTITVGRCLGTAIFSCPATCTDGCPSGTGECNGIPGTCVGGVINGTMSDVALDSNGMLPRTRTPRTGTTISAGYASIETVFTNDATFFSNDIGYTMTNDAATACLETGYYQGTATTSATELSALCLDGYFSLAIGGVRAPNGVLEAAGLAVTGDSSLSNLNVSGAFRAARLEVDAVTGATLVQSKRLEASSMVADEENVTVSAPLYSSANLTTSASVNALEGHFQRDLVVEGTVRAGNVLFTGVNVGQGTTIGEDSSTISGTLTAGAGVFNGPVSAQTVMAVRANVTETLQVDGTATVGGALTAASVSAGDGTFTTLLVLGGGTLSAPAGDFTGGLTAGTVEAGGVTVTTTLSVGGSASITGAMSAQSATITEALDLGQLRVEGGANVTGDVIVGGTLSVAGDIVLDVMTTRSATITEALDLGQLRVGDANVTNDVIVGGTLAASNVVSDGITVASGATVGALTVELSATIRGALNAEGGLRASSANVTGDVVVNGRVKAASAEFAQILLTEVDADTVRATAANFSSHVDVGGRITAGEAAFGRLDLNEVTAQSATFGGDVSVGGELRTSRGMFCATDSETDVLGRNSVEVCDTSTGQPGPSIDAQRGAETKFHVGGVLKVKVDDEGLVVKGNATFNGPVYFNNAATFNGNVSFTTSSNVQFSSSVQFDAPLQATYDTYNVSANGANGAREVYVHTVSGRIEQLLDSTTPDLLAAPGTHSITIYSPALQSSSIMMVDLDDCGVAVSHSVSVAGGQATLKLTPTGACTSPYAFTFIVFQAGPSSSSASR